MSVKWCAVEQKGHSEALWCGSSYPGGLIGGTGLATWGPRRLVGPLLHTCQRERCTTQSESQDNSHSSMYGQYICTPCVSLTQRHDEEVVNSWIIMTKLIIKYSLSSCLSLWWCLTMCFQFKTVSKSSVSKRVFLSTCLSCVISLYCTLNMDNPTLKIMKCFPQVPCALFSMFNLFK